MAAKVRENWGRGSVPGVGILAGVGLFLGVSGVSVEAAPPASTSAETSAGSGSAVSATGTTGAAVSGAKVSMEGDVFVMPKQFKSTKSGLGYVVLKEGTGAKAKKGQKVTVHYTGWLTNGTKFDSSRDRKEPFQFRLGAGQVIDGWDEGVAMMKAGDKYTFILPSKLGYGVDGAPPDIPPNATLVFNVELIESK